MDDTNADAIVIGTDLLLRFGTAYPRLTAAATVLLGALAVLGFICAQIDAAALEAQGYPRAARAVRWGQQGGAFALALWRSRKTPKETSKS